MGRYSSPSDYDASESMGDPVPRQERSQPRPQSGQKLEKPEPRKRSKARKDREDEKRLQEFRDRVWAREQMGVYPDQHAPCFHCRQIVWRTGHRFGEVHHRIGRRAKATRYDPNNGVILCGALVNDCHGKATRHEIDV